MSRLLYRWWLSDPHAGLEQYWRLPIISYHSDRPNSPAAPREWYKAIITHRFPTQVICVRGESVGRKRRTISVSCNKRWRGGPSVPLVLWVCCIRRYCSVYGSIPTSRLEVCQWSLGKNWSCVVLFWPPGWGGRGEVKYAETRLGTFFFFFFYNRLFWRWWSSGLSVLSKSID